MIEKLDQRLSKIPGLVDVHVQQELDAPTLSYAIDRTRAEQLGYNVSSIVNNMNTSLSSSEQVSPEFLDRSEEWNSLLSCRANTGIPHRQSECAQQHANQQRVSTQAPVPNTLGNVASVKREAMQSVLQPVEYTAGLRRLRQCAG